ncbi:hypothetical protein TrispH2_007410 [Trichoplax sp. H2]|nr:hypothetical protein TrispH2_007410 [Trichoplax sp. H2]|eukprot:RDD40878.1 hypothetical protein TrispH2_007410 [Trichoplax sp. H2]
MFARLTGMVTNHFRGIWPHLKPLRTILFGFAVSGYMISKIPQTDEMRANSAFVEECSRFKGPGKNVGVNH